MLIEYLEEGFLYCFLVFFDIRTSVTLKLFNLIFKSVLLRRVVFLEWSFSCGFDVLVRRSSKQKTAKKRAVVERPWSQHGKSVE